MTPEQVRARTRATYRAHGLAFDAQRPKALIERPWLDRLLSFTQPGDEVLDLGCGAGEPVAAYLIAQGRRVCGLDFAGPSLALARRRFPRHRWIEGDMRRLDLPHRFVGIVAWDSFFHLAPDEQARTLPLIARHLLPSGAFLVTVGPPPPRRWERWTAPPSTIPASRPKTTAPASRPAACTWRPSRPRTRTATSTPCSSPAADAGAAPGVAPAGADRPRRAAGVGASGRRPGPFGFSASDPFKSPPVRAMSHPVSARGLWR